MKLEFDDREVDYIAQVLGQRPWAEVNPLMQKLVAQANGPANRPAPAAPPVLVEAVTPTPPAEDA